MSRWPAFMLFIVVVLWSELPAQVQTKVPTTSLP